MNNNPINITAIDHLVLRTAHADALTHFYCSVLGCTVERDMSEALGLIQLRAGTALIDIVAVDSELGLVGGGPPTKKDNNLDHLCLRIEPFSEQAVIRYLNLHQIEHGVFTERYGAGGFARSIYIKDPDGNTVELRA